jgi:hypothetical protein
MPGSPGTRLAPDVPSGRAAQRATLRSPTAPGTRLAQVRHGEYGDPCVSWMRFTESGHLEALMTAGPGKLLVALQAKADVDAEELVHLADRLRVGLHELDVDAVQLTARGEVPADSMGAARLTAGELVVRFAASRDALLSIISGAWSWLGRQRLRSVALTVDGDRLEVTGVNSARQDRLTDHWVTRHAGAA